MLISPDDDALDELFLLVAARIFCKNGSACMDCPECRKILHDSNPDVIHVNSERAKIKVDDVSKMLGTVYVRPIGERKLYYIHRADLMNAQAQNKLLKTLEEPPENVTVFLGTANEKAMLETIRSRSRKIYLDPFNEETVEKAMISLGFSEDESLVAAACSEGMLGKALAVCSSDKYVSLFNMALDTVRRLKRSSDILEIGSGISALESPVEFLDMLSLVMRDMLVAESSADMVHAKHVLGEIEGLAADYSSEALSKILLLINDARRKLSLNLNISATVDNLLFAILEVKHKCPRL